MSFLELLHNVAKSISVGMLTYKGEGEFEGL